MDGERISLRLEPEDLVLLDDFIEKHPEYSNRSNFARVAIRSFIDQFNGDRTSGIATKKRNVITIEIPRFAHETIMASVRAGIFNSPEDAVVECVSKRYINTEEAIEMLRRERMEVLKGTVQVISD